MLLANPLVSDDYDIVVVESVEAFMHGRLRCKYVFATGPLVIRANALDEDVVSGRNVTVLNVPYSSIPESVKDSAKSFRCISLGL
jgi:hypothetical protein